MIVTPGVHRDTGYRPRMRHSFARFTRALDNGRLSVTRTRHITRSHQAVVTCEDAARARGIPLRQELKTLMLFANQQLTAVHLSGADRLIRRAVRRTVHAHDIRFVRVDELRLWDLEPGTINPWSVPADTVHLVCLRALAIPVLATNDRTLTGSYFFSSSVLRELPGVEIGVFGRARS